MEKLKLIVYLVNKIINEFYQPDNAFAMINITIKIIILFVKNALIHGEQL